MAIEKGAAFGINADGKIGAAAWFGTHPGDSSKREAQNFVRRGARRVRTLAHDDPKLTTMFDAFVRDAVPES